MLLVGVGAREAWLLDGHGEHASVAATDAQRMRHAPRVERRSAADLGDFPNPFQENAAAGGDDDVRSLKGLDEVLVIIFVRCVCVGAFDPNANNCPIYARTPYNSTNASFLSQIYFPFLDYP